MSRRRFLRIPAKLPASLKTGICLHAHTLHSKESLTFLTGLLRRVAPLAWATRWQQRRRSHEERPIDFSRLWWTPPLSAHQVWELETQRIRDGLGLDPIVSITDHDNLDAPAGLRILQDGRNTPVSVEWTVPYEDTFFHLGVHNLPAGEARALLAAMQTSTALPTAARLGGMLSEFDGQRGVLIVLNHPLWDEKGIGKDDHRRRLAAFLRRFGGTVHALEWNGFRPWRENREILTLSEAFQIPLVAGGDTHGRQPSSVLNLTAAGCFEEFAQDVRAKRQHAIALMPEHQEHLRVRIVECICEILREDPNHSLGWSRWSDRVFYRNAAGEAVPLSVVWGHITVPFLVRQFVGLMSLVDAGLGHSPFRSAVRLALAQGEEAP